MEEGRRISERNIRYLHRHDLDPDSLRSGSGLDVMICKTYASSPSHLEREVHGRGGEGALVGVAVVPRDGRVVGAGADGEGGALERMIGWERGLRRQGNGDLLVRSQPFDSFPPTPDRKV